MLFIYSSLPLGGIETFFLRLARQRKKDGLVTKFIFMSSPKESNSYLLEELMKFSEVYFSYDVFLKLPYISSRLPLISPLNKKTLISIAKDIERVHVSCGIHALFAIRIMEKIKRDLILTIGLYHSLEFAWGDNKKLPYFEKVNRNLVLSCIPKKNLFWYSDSMIDFYESRLDMSFKEAQTFRLGVIERKGSSFKKLYSNTSINKINICSVGRLTGFKTYNLWMLQIVFNLKHKGYDVTYDVYGEGEIKDEMKNKILELGISDNVSLKGLLPYKNFGKTVIKYDLFIGSGTAIIEASSLGVCSLIGIESIQTPETYGFFKDFYKVDYNINSLDYEKVSVQSKIIDFMGKSNEDKNLMSEKHLMSVEDFYIDTCSQNFSKYGHSIFSYRNFNYNKFLYSLNIVFYVLFSKFKGASNYRNRYS